MTVDALTLQQTRSRSGRIVALLFDLFLRGLAIVFFAGTIYSWLKVVGYWEGPQNRFDTMTVQLRAYSAVMVVMLPVTSVGLWTTLPWGRVVWFFAIAFQSVSVLRFAGALDLPQNLVWFHMSCLAIYLCFQVSLYFIDKKA